MPIDAGLFARMDVSLAAYWGAYALGEGSEWCELPGGWFFHTPIPLYLFNSVILTRGDRETVGEALRLAGAKAAVGQGPILWRLGPGAASNDVVDRLEREGLKRHGSDPAMVADLAALPDQPHVEGIEIRTSEGKEARHAWGELTSDGFELSDIRGPIAKCEAAIPERLYPDHVRFAGYLDGRPVAVSSLVMAGDLAGIYAVATLPEARGRGVGSAMTLHAMREGRRRGARQAVLQATPMGRPIYERIGFAQVFDYVCYLQH